MEVKFKLDTKKASKAAVAIAATYGLCCVSEGTKFSQLAAAKVFALIAIIAILYPCLVPKKSALTGMMPDAITLLLKEARDAFPSFEGKPKDDDLLSIRETLLPILMEIPYDQLEGVHSLTALLTDPAKYAADHGATFVSPVRLPLYDSSIANNATTVIRIRTESAHKARLDNFASYKGAERGAAKFLHETVNKVWYNNLKDANTFYTKVSALEIMTFLDANSRGLHAIDMISLHINMHQYYMQADGIPQYIVMLGEAQKRQSERACPLPTSSLS
jgi:hypothetical protein